MLGAIEGEEKDMNGWVDGLVGGDVCSSVQMEGQRRIIVHKKQI